MAAAGRRAGALRGRRRSQRSCAAARSRHGRSGKSRAAAAGTGVGCRGYSRTRSPERTPDWWSDAARVGACGIPKALPFHRRRLRLRHAATNGEALCRAPARGFMAASESAPSSRHRAWLLTASQALSSDDRLMRSAAHLRGHPIHPAIIPFPLAFLWGAFVFDLLGRFLDHPGFWQTGQYLAIAGILTALAAAVPGFIDYFPTVPPHSSGKERATKHMLLNLATVAVFAVAAILRVRTPGTPVNSVLILEAVGVAMLSMAGWLGGVLVSRNQISVDHRYARTGKWKEVRISGQK